MLCRKKSISLTRSRICSRSKSRRTRTCRRQEPQRRRKKKTKEGNDRLDENVYLVPQQQNMRVCHCRFSLSLPLSLSLFKNSARGTCARPARPHGDSRVRGHYGEKKTEGGKGRLSPKQSYATHRLSVWMAVRKATSIKPYATALSTRSTTDAARISWREVRWFL